MASWTQNKGLCKVVLLCISWYLISSTNNIIGKTVLTHFPYPMTMTMVQLLTITVLSGPLFDMWGVRKFVDIPWDYYCKLILPLAFGKFMASVFSHVSIWKVPVSYAHTDVPSPACSLVKYSDWKDISHADLGISWAPLDLAQVFITRMRSCTVLCSAAVILLVLAVFFGLLGHCNNDNKTIIACGLFILGGLSLGCGLITFVAGLSQTMAEIYEYYSDETSGPDYDYRYGWCFFTAGFALVLTYVGSAFSFVGYLNRYTSIDDMVREMVPGADRKLREHKISTEYLIRHSNAHPILQHYDPIVSDQQIPLEQYESNECGPLLNKTPPDVCTTNRCQEFITGAEVSNAGALEINFCASGSNCNAHLLAGQTIPITIKNHNTSAPLSFSNIPVSKYGTMPHNTGTTLHQGFLGVSEMGSSSSNSSSGYCGRSKTLQHPAKGPGRVGNKKSVKIESFQVPETSFEGFGKSRTGNPIQYSGSAV